MTAERVPPLHWLCLALSLALQATAVVLGKTAALHMQAPTAAAFATNPWYLGGLACLALQAVCWQLVLRRVPFFVAYLVTSLNYPLILAASAGIFRERVTLLHVVGASVIVAGVFVIVRDDLA